MYTIEMFERSSGERVAVFEHVPREDCKWFMSCFKNSPDDMPKDVPIAFKNCTILIHNEERRKEPCHLGEKDE